jgi:hypothetical protein
MGRSERRIASFGIRLHLKALERYGVTRRARRERLNPSEINARF